MSNHGHGESLPIPDIRLGPKAASVERISGVIGGLGVLLCVAGFFANRAEFFQSYLFAFLYWGGFTLGGLGVLVLNHTVGGRWGVTSRRYVEAQMRTLPFIFLLFLILLIGLKDLYPWTHISSVADPVSRDILYKKVHYLNVPFFIVRTIAYFAIWMFWGLRVYRWSDEQDRTGDPTIRERMRKFSAPGCLIVTFTVTFAYIDWILSADAQFFSTIYRAMLLFGDVLQTFALTILALVLTSRGDRFGGRINGDSARCGQHDVRLHDFLDISFGFATDYRLAGQPAAGDPVVPGARAWRLDHCGLVSGDGNVPGAVPRAALTGPQTRSETADARRDLDSVRASGRDVLDRRTDLPD